MLSRHLGNASRSAPKQHQHRQPHFSAQGICLADIHPNIDLGAPRTSGLGPARLLVRCSDLSGVEFEAESKSTASLGSE